MKKINIIESMDQEDRITEKKEVIDQDRETNQGGEVLNIGINPDTFISRDENRNWNKNQAMNRERTHSRSSRGNLTGKSPPKG